MTSQPPHQPSLRWGGRKQAAGARYLLQVSGSQTASLSLRVHDLDRNRVILQWNSAIGQRLLASPAAPVGARRNGFFPLTKRGVKRLTLVAMSIRMVLDAPGRRRERRRQKPGLHRYVADMLRERAGEHLLAEDIVASVLARLPATDPALVERCLGELVDHGKIQRIAIDAATIFYDADTRAHLHVYDPDSRTLTDAPTQGVIVTTGEQHSG